MTAETVINTIVILQQTEPMFNQPRPARLLGSAMAELRRAIETKQRKDEMVGGLGGRGTKIVLEHKIGRFEIVLR